MKNCKQCQAPFDENLSLMTLGELREISYDKNLLSDARDNNFCSKWCDREASNAEYKKRSEGMTIVIGAGALRRKALKSVSLGEGAQSPILKDKVLFKHITEGKASDKKITADVTAAEIQSMKNKKEAYYAPKYKSIKEKRERYKAKYGYDPG